MAIVNIQIVVTTLWVGLQVKNAEGERDHISLGNLETRVYMSQTLRDGMRRESGFQHAAVELTHSDSPGAFAVWFVEAWEPLTADEPRVCHQVPSTVEHRPEGDRDTVMDTNWGQQLS